MAQNRVMEDNLTGTSLNIPIFKCPLASCNYTTTNYRSLTIHAAIHSGTRQYKCPVEKCNFHALKRNKVLNHYADVHPSLTPISVNAIIPVEDIPPLQGESVCKYEGCKYHTKRSSDMKYHLKVHSGVKDYECQYKNCHFSAYRLSDLSYHKKLYHNNNSESTLSSSPINNTSNITTPTNISPSPPLSPSLVSSSSSSLNMNNGTKRKRNDDMIISNSIPIPLMQNQSESNNIQQQTSQVITIIPPSSSSTTATTPISISDINTTTTTTTNPIQQATTTTTINQQIGNNNNEIITTSSEVGGVTNTNTVSPTSSTDEPQRKRICCIKQSCPINGCPLIFDSYNHMLQHLYVHTGEKLYKCPVANCNFAGSRISSVREHSKSIHPTIPSVEPIKLSGPTQDVEGYYHCNECTEKYKNLIDYRVHLASHKGVFNCPIDGCTYTAIRKSLIQSHLIIHSNKTLSCEHPGCIFKTNNPRAYDKHIKTHQNELLSNSLISNIPLQSPFITTTTTTNGNNNNNNLSGTPQPPPILPATAATTTNTISSSSSSNTSSLLNTVLTKNPKDGLFHCIYDNCSYSTIRKCNMKRHFNSHKDSNYSYAPKNEYKCSEPNCHFTTLCSSLFYEHAKNFHGGANVPPENTKEICCSFPHCEFKTHTLKNLSRHKIRMHNYDAKYYKCSEGDCTKVLKSKPELNMHLENHRQKKMMVTSNT